MAKMNWEQARKVRPGPATGTDRGKNTDYIKGPRATDRQLRYLETLSKRLGFQSAGAFLASISASPTPTRRGAAIAIETALCQIGGAGSKP